MPRKSSAKVEGKSVAFDDFIPEQKADEFMAEVSAPVEPEKRVEMNGLLDKLVPRPAEEQYETTDIIDKILSSDAPKKKRGRKEKVQQEVPVMESLRGLEVSPAAPVVDMDAEKAKVVSRIQMNISNFEVVLQDVLRPNKDDFLKALPKKGLGELRVILKTIEHTRAVNNMANQMKGMVMMGASGVEMLTSQFGLRTQGYAHMIRAQDEEIQSILREIAFERAEQLTAYQRPELRLTLLLTTTLLAVDSRNRMAEFRQMSHAQAQAEVPAEAEQKYGDL